MGAAAIGSKGRSPPFENKDLRILYSYGLGRRELSKLWNTFIDVDVNSNGAWTLAEVYFLIQEPRFSMRAPVLDKLFFYADQTNEGGVCFQDFVVTFCSFCALSAEEILQFMFMIMDLDRNGYVEKSELIRYFDYIPGGLGDDDAVTKPVFPVNNKNALDKFRDGEWDKLDFDGMVQLCERFPFISYPAYHVQELLRKALLGKKFWKQLDAKRIKQQTRHVKPRREKLPGEHDITEIYPPPRSTWQEILDFSNRKTKVLGGKRVLKSEEEEEQEKGAIITAHTLGSRDQRLSRTPLIVMVRNDRCMYHVPYKTAEEAKAAFQQSQQTRPHDDDTQHMYHLDPNSHHMPLEDDLGKKVDLRGVINLHEDGDLGILAPRRKQFADDDESYEGSSASELQGLDDAAKPALHAA